MPNYTEAEKRLVRRVAERLGGGYHLSDPETADIARAVLAEGEAREELDKPEKYRVWACKIVLKGDAILPVAFDGPPRMAAIGAVEDAGLNVIGCFSGWAAELTEEECAVIEDHLPNPALAPAEKPMERTALELMGELREILAIQFRLRTGEDSHPATWGKGSLGRDSMDDFDEALALIRADRERRDRAIAAAKRMDEMVTAHTGRERCESCTIQAGRVIAILEGREP